MGAAIEQGQASSSSERSSSDVVVDAARPPNSKGIHTFDCQLVDYYHTAVCTGCNPPIGPSPVEQPSASLFEHSAHLLPAQETRVVQCINCLLLSGCAMHMHVLKLRLHH
jgi:hypothetical protein